MSFRKGAKDIKKEPVQKYKIDVRVDDENGRLYLVLEERVERLSGLVGWVVEWKDIKSRWVSLNNSEFPQVIASARAELLDYAELREQRIKEAGQ